MRKTELENFYTEWDSPLGTLILVASNLFVEAVVFSDDEKWMQRKEMYQFGKNIILEQTIIQLKQYFEGSRTTFDLPINQIGTNFQQQVWAELNTIPYACTKTYSQLALQMGSKNKTRAVASANSKNQLLIIVPCHRIIGENNKLIGYRGGLDRKRWLINFENETNMLLSSQTPMNITFTTCDTDGYRHHPTIKNKLSADEDSLRNTSKTLF